MRSAEVYPGQNEKSTIIFSHEHEQQLPLGAILLSDLNKQIRIRLKGNKRAASIATTIETKVIQYFYDDDIFKNPELYMAHFGLELYRNWYLTESAVNYLLTETDKIRLISGFGEKSIRVLQQAINEIINERTINKGTKWAHLIEISE